MLPTYTRDDIYYCAGCGEFFDLQTNERVEVPYTEMPAKFAMKVMSDRQRPFKPCHTRRRSSSRKKTKGFDKSNG
jgi:hypothetical protein